MRAAIFDPYLDTGGGGERYVLTVAAVLAKHGFSVDVFWKDRKIGKWLEERLGIDLAKINFVQDLGRGAGYDFVFWLSDGSVPTLFGKKNILHFQTPFRNIGGRNLFNRLKFLKINDIVCNSKFTKTFIDAEYDVSSKVIYPPVDIMSLEPGKKENIILYVGRFSELQQTKRQDILIKSFKKLYDAGLAGWKLFLAGGSNVGGENLVKRLKQDAKGYPIEILENIPFDQIKKLYGKAKIFWSAAGYGVDEEKNPEKVEHFGITVVEAMASGCVPLVTNKGGHKEIIEDGKTGFLWNSVEELEKITTDLIIDERRREKIAKEAKESSRRFGIVRFEKEILALVS